MPFSIAAATVKILNVDPAPSPTCANGSGWTVCRLPTSSPYTREEFMATMSCEVSPGLITFMTWATFDRVGLAVSFPSGWQLNTSVAVASTVDSVKDGFGASVLLPGSGKGKLSTFIFEVFAPPMPKLWHVGVHGYLSGGNSTWVTDSTHSRNAAVMGVGLGVYRDFLCTCRLLDTDVAITMTAGLALRTLQGNVAQSPTVLQAALHGSKDRSFAGAEFGLALTIGSVRAGVQYYQMGKADDDISVASLTGGQLVVGISVAGAIVSGPLSPK